MLRVAADKPKGAGGNAGGMCKSVLLSRLEVTAWLVAVICCMQTKGICPGGAAPSNCAGQHV